MRRGILATFVVLAIAAGSCAADGDVEPTTASSSPVTTSPVTTSPVTTSPVAGSQGTTESSTTSGAGEAIDGDPAADFELALDGGGTFSLSGEAKPVYLIFWAEW
jgi:hypothetical protein